MGIWVIYFVRKCDNFYITVNFLNWVSDFRKVVLSSDECFYFSIYIFFSRNALKNSKDYILEKIVHSSRFKVKFIQVSLQSRRSTYQVASLLGPGSWMCRIISKLAQIGSFIIFNINKGASSGRDWLVIQTDVGFVYWNLILWHITCCSVLILSSRN